MDETKNIDVDFITLNNEEKEDLERLAALGYSVADMALYFDKPIKEFKHDANTVGCVIHYHIKRGKLIIKANADMQLMISAESGNLTAIQQLAKATARNEFRDMLRQLEDDEI